MDTALGVATDDKGLLVAKVSINQSDASVVAIQDKGGTLLGFADMGRASVLDAGRSTVLEVNAAGDCRGHDGMGCGAFLEFEYGQTKLVAFIFLALAPDILKPKPKSLLRSLRKSVASASGTHGFFAKAAG